MKKYLSLVICALFITTACSGGKKESENKAEYQIAAISGYFAQGFGVKIVEGLDKAKEDLDIEYKLIDTGTRSLDYQEQFNSVAKTGRYDLVLVMGWELVDSLLNTAAAYPDQKFIFVDGILDNPNITYVSFAEHEGSFLAGALAACMSSGKDTVGFVGGRDIPVIRNFLYGYEQGVKYINPNIEVKSIFAGSFDDPGRGKELALSLYNDGVDVVYSVAGPTGEGVLQAVKGLDNKYAIGVDLDQSATAPENIPTSVVKYVDRGVYNIIKKLVDNKGEFEPYTQTLGVADSGVGIIRNQSYSNLVPANIQAKIDDIESEISAGKISIKSVYQK